MIRPGYRITIASVNKKSGEETSTRLHRTRPAKKIMVVIFRDKYSILLTEHLPRGSTISSPYYASTIERLCCAILEKSGGKVVLLLHGNALIHKCNIGQAAILEADFVELNHPVYSPNMALSDYYLLSNFFMPRIFVAMMLKTT